MKNETENQQDLLDIETLKSDIDAGDYGDDLSDYSSYICDAISEIADSNTSIYYSDIQKFISENVDAVNDAIAEMGWDGCGSDLHKAGQMAEYLQIQRNLYDNLEGALQNAAVNYLMFDKKIFEISQDKWNEILEKCGELDNNDKMSDLTDFIDELFEEQKDATEEETAE